MKRIMMAAMALSLLTGTVAFADPPGGHDDGSYHQWRHDDGNHQDRRHEDRDHREWRHDDRDHREWRRDDHDRGEHRDEYRDEHRPEWRGDHDGYRHYARFDSGEYHRPRGYYMHRWHRGERLPLGFRASAYVVPDVGVYHLRPPPRGYYWVRVDNNAVLAAVATGAVIDVAYNLFH